MREGHPVDRIGRTSWQCCGTIFYVTPLPTKMVRFWLAGYSGIGTSDAAVIFGVSGSGADHGEVVVAGHER